MSNNARFNKLSKKIKAAEEERKRIKKELDAILQWNYPNSENLKNIKEKINGDENFKN